MKKYGGLGTEHGVRLTKLTEKITDNDTKANLK